MAATDLIVLKSQPENTMLTHSWLVFHWKIVICTYDAFENNFKIKYKLVIYLKESCKLSSHEQFPFDYFPKDSFIREMSPKLSGLFFGCHRLECVKKPAREHHTMLTHSWLVFCWKIFICTYDVFENNYKIKYKLVKYLKESFKLIYYERFPFNYFPKDSFIREISPKLSGLFLATKGMNV